MPRPPADDQNGSGVLVYPKLDKPHASRDSAPPGNYSHPKFPNKARRRAIAVGAIALAAVIGALVGYALKSSHADELADAHAKQQKAEQAQAAASGQLQDAQKQLDALRQEKAGVDQQLAALTDKSTGVDKKAAELAAEQQKLQATIDASSGTVDTEGNEIHLRLIDKVLFATGDDQLTEKGKAVLDKVAVALADLPDKQIWVQGHTDDQPIFVHKDPKAKAPPPPPPTTAKTAKPPPQRFITNWELSAARALQVVHYLQDVSKIDPSRLAALAFGQYRPVSKTNKAANRRIEIVLYPKREVLEKAAPKK